MNSENIYRYIVRFTPLLVFFGFVFSLLQKLARFFYYHIDHRYLMEIRTEEVLQGLSSLLVFIYYAVIVYYTYNSYRENRLSLSKNLISIYCVNFEIALLYIVIANCIKSYCFNFLSIFIDISSLAILTVTAILIGILLKKIIIKNSDSQDISQDGIFPYTKYREWYACISIIIFMFCIFMYQIIDECINKSFSYTTQGDNDYVIITTFKDCYIAIRSKIENDTITIYPGKVRLFKLEQEITAHEFKEKIMR